MPKGEKGKSHSTRPVSKRLPSWCRYTAEEVEALVIKLAKEGNNPSKIGTVLRDQYGIPLVKPVIGKSVAKAMAEAGLALPTPEDLAVLLRKASSLRAHLEKNPKDLHNKRALQLIEAKIHRLSNYYKRENVLPPDWKYEPKVASLV